MTRSECQPLNVLVLGLIFWVDLFVFPSFSRFPGVTLAVPGCPRPPKAPQSFLWGNPKAPRHLLALPTPKSPNGPGGSPQLPAPSPAHSTGSRMRSPGPPLPSPHKDATGSNPKRLEKQLFVVFFFPLFPPFFVFPEIFQPLATLRSWLRLGFVCLFVCFWFGRWFFLLVFFYRVFFILFPNCIV